MRHRFSNRRQRHHENQLAQLSEVIISFRHMEQALCGTIKAEEERACVHDCSDPNYPADVRSLQGRLANIRATIARLETQRALIIGIVPAAMREASVPVRGS
jgi:hypothetical protein